MIIFINDERAYLAWITHHRQALVLDGRRQPKVRQLLLHRGVCAEIRGGGSKHTHLTTGGRFKACSADAEELQAWAVEESGARAAACDRCRPEEPAQGGGGDEIHLTKLAADILDYVLDAALIHMEHADPPYHLTVGDIAACFGKTPGQVATPLGRLLEEGLVTTDGREQAGANIGAGAIKARRIVWPTVRAIRTLESFREESDAAIEAELAKLRDE